MKIPEWMDARTVAAMRAAERRGRAQGRDGSGDAWEVAAGHHPALPTTMIMEAVAAVLAPPQASTPRDSSAACSSLPRR